MGAIFDSNRDKPDLLLACLVDSPENDALLAKLLNDPADLDETEITFEALSSAYTSCASSATNNGIGEASSWCMPISVVFL